MEKEMGTHSLSKLIARRSESCEERCFRREDQVKARSLFSGLRRKTCLFGGNQPAEVALSQLRNCPSSLLSVASGIRGEPRFLGCNRTLRSAVLGECGSVPESAGIKFYF